MSFSLPDLPVPPQYIELDTLRQQPGFFFGVRPMPRERGVPRRFDEGLRTGPIVQPLPVPNPFFPAPTTPLADLLTRGFNPKGPPSLFSELINRPPPISDFERLLQRPLTPRGSSEPITARSGSLLAALARGSALIGGLLYSEPAGLGSDRREEFAPDFGNEWDDEPPLILRGPSSRPVTRGQDSPESPRARLPESTQTDPRRPVPFAAPVSPRTVPLPYLPPISISEPDIEAPRLPQIDPLPKVGSPTLPSPFSWLNPFAFPFPLPLSLLRPAPTRSPRTFANPLTDTSGSVYRSPRINSRPLTAFQPQPLPSALTNPARANDCSCPGKPTKERKKRKPRVECFEGTYRENAKGITKFRKRKIPCQ